MINNIKEDFSMYDATLKIELRKNTGKAANSLLRKKGYLPGNISGKGQESIAIVVRKDEFRRALREQGRNTVLKLELSGGDSYTVMTKEIYVTPLVNELSHVDFQAVSLSEKVKQNVPVRIVGTEFVESKRLLVNGFVDVIPVYGLPADIPHEIEVDVATLMPGDTILLKDIKLPEGITTDLDQDEKIVSVKGSKIQEVITEDE